LVKGKKLFDQGISGCIVSANSKRDFTPLCIKEFEDNDGKNLPKLVNIDLDIAELFINNLFILKRNIMRK
jgi:6-phosphofructokinase 1